MGADGGLGERARFFCPTTIHSPPSSWSMGGSLVAVGPVIIMVSSGSLLVSIILVRILVVDEYFLLPEGLHVPAYLRDRRCFGPIIDNPLRQVEIRSPGFFLLKIGL